jgi:sugar O-acyltransferase (sialic acid O-acetyltransferase NeuD family)
MSKTYVIWGCSGHAKVLVSLIKEQGGRVAAFFDNREMPSVSPGVPVYHGESGFAEWLKETQNSTSIYGLVAIGGHGGSDRIKIQSLFRVAGLRLDSIVHPHASVCSTVTLGEGVQVLAQAVVAAESRLGEACIVNHKASIDHECVLGNGVHVAPGATICGCVTIGDDVLIGAGAVILPRLRIGHGSIIGAGSVVVKNVAAESVVVGNPGKPMRN